MRDGVVYGNTDAKYRENDLFVEVLPAHHDIYPDIYPDIFRWIREEGAGGLVFSSHRAHARLGVPASQELEEYSGGESLGSVV